MLNLTTIEKQTLYTQIQVWKTMHFYNDLLNNFRTQIILDQHTIKCRPKYSNGTHSKADVYAWQLNAFATIYVFIYIYTFHLQNRLQDYNYIEDVLVMVRVKFSNPEIHI